MDYNYRINALNFLYYLKDSIEVDNEDYMLIKEAIDFLQKDKIYRSDIPPHFQLAISKGQNVFYYLTFDDNGFHFSNYFGYNDGYHQPIDIRVNYKKGVRKDIEGYVMDWEERARIMLQNYSNGERDGYSNISVSFSCDF